MGSGADSRMDITVRDNPGASRYEGLMDGKVVGVARYRIDGDLMDLFHTEVEPQLEGHGLGGQIVQAALDGARDRGLRVRPSCWFVARYVSEHQEHSDLVRLPGA